MKGVVCRRILLCIVCIAIWAIPLPANEVTSEGTAEIFNENFGNASDQALQNALRQAVEQSVADLVDSKIMARNFQILDDVIFSSSRNFVTRYQILKKGRIANNTVFQVEIRAWIAEKAIHDKLTELRLLHPKIVSKRLMLIYHKQDPRALDRHSTPVPANLGIIYDLFRQEGFQLFNENEMDLIYQALDGHAVINRPIENLIFLAMDRQSDILVAVELVTSKAGRERGSFETMRTDVHLSIYDVTTGRQIAEILGSGKKLKTGLPVSSEQEFFEKIGATAARRAANTALRKIKDYFQTTGDQGLVYLIVFRNYNRDEVDKIIDYLESVYAFKDLSQLKNAPGHLEIELISSESKIRLRRKIQWELKSQNIEMNSHESTGNRLLFIKPGTEIN